MSLRVYEYDNTMTGLGEWVVEDTETLRDVKTFWGPFAKLRARLYVWRHRG